MRGQAPSTASGSASGAELATASYLADREELLRRPGPPSPGRRSALVALTDVWLAELFRLSGAQETGAALVAVGGYGRGNLGVGSDLDLLLLQRDASDAAADRIWYPIWDSGIRLDHSVRTAAEARRLAGDDFKVLLGLLDARTIAGDDILTLSMMSSVRSDWRAFAPKRLEEIRASVDERRERSGEVAHLLEPDLKESFGGLRDLVVLRAISASWVTDAPHSELEASRELLMNARDALHSRTGKSGDRLLMQEQEGVAESLGLDGSEALMRAISTAGREIAWACDSTWYRVGRATRRSPRRPFRRVRSERRPLDTGVVEQAGDVVLAVNADPRSDWGLSLRAAAAAAQAGLRLTPHTVERLAEESAPMPVPWPRSARESLVSLLGAGRSMIPVWESLAQANIISDLIPGWEVVRSAPQRNPVHRFTVDRHLVETAANAARYQREVARPDLLLVGALLHDIGKGRPGTDHTDLGVELVSEIAPHLGFNAPDSATLVGLVQHHLLLPEVATRRDPDDPATLQIVIDAVGDEQMLDLLYALTRADAQATGPAAWTDWRAALVADLVSRVRAALAGSAAPQLPDLASEHAHLLGAGETEVVVSDAAPGDLTRVTVVSPDARGLLATVAGVLSMNRLDVRAARIANESGMGVSEWWVSAPFGGVPSAARLRENLTRVVAGTLDVAEKLERRESDYASVTKPFTLEPQVQIAKDASDRATVVEVRTYNRPGALFRLAGTITRGGATISAARADTLGSNVIDVFYMTDDEGGPLSASATTELLKQLTDAATD